MSWIDRLEKLGRLLLWLAITSAFVAVPLAYARGHRAEEELRAALQKVETELADARKPKPVERIQLASMGNYLYGLNQATGTGHLTFTNASPRSGILCIYGSARNTASGNEIGSLPTCQQVGPYASLVDMRIVFAAGDLDVVCGKTKCQLQLADAALAEGERLAEK